MKSKQTHKFLAPLFAAFLLALPISATAAPINGAIGFGGTFNPTGGSSLIDATGLDFLTSYVVATSGDFAAVPILANVAFTDFMFNPLYGSVSPLWLVGTGGPSGGAFYSFELDNISIDMQSATALNLSGTGTVFADGFDATAASWVFSGDTIGNILFTFSSITAANAVPEPGVLALFGIGMLSMGVLRRRRTA